MKVLAALMWLLASASPAPAAGPFSFAVLGDAPYYPWEEIQYRRVLREIDEADLTFVIHVGDILRSPCTDERYRETLDGFNRLRHPLVLTPGDNEWTDCWRRDEGGFVPLERLSRLREVFYADPARSLGGAPMPLRTQARSDSFPEFVENARWVHEGVVFVTVHLPGSRNARESFPGRTRADDDAADRRTAAAAAWMRAAFAEARTLDARALVLAMHGNPGFEQPAANPFRSAWEPFLSALAEEAERFGRPVLVANGDGHEYLVDRPLAPASGAAPLANFTRVQVPGSPRVGWVRVTVTPDAAQPFVFDCRVVSRWKVW